MASYEKLDYLRRTMAELESRTYSLYSLQDQLYVNKVPIIDPACPTSVMTVIDSVDAQNLKEIIRRQNETIILLQKALEILLDGII